MTHPFRKSAEHPPLKRDGPGGSGIIELKKKARVVKIL